MKYFTFRPRRRSLTGMDKRCTPSYHEALKTTWRVGQELTHIGVQDFGRGKKLEMCNCKKCGSTLAREVK